MVGVIAADLRPPRRGEIPLRPSLKRVAEPAVQLLLLRRRQIQNRCPHDNDLQKSFI